MKIIFILLLTMGILLPGAIKECGTDDRLTQEDYLQHLSDFPGSLFHSRENLWVPITFHVLRTDNGIGGLSQERLDMGVEDLNAAAGDSNLRYYQLGETDYIDDTNFYSGIDTYQEIDSLRTVNTVPNTLNIYCVVNLNNGNTDLCGISTFSWYESQGIIMANDCFAAPDNHTTLPHEVGHYFDLYHTHQGSSDHDGDGIIDGDNAEFVDGTECDIRGDGLCDTVADPNLSDLVSVNCDYFGNYLDGHLQPYAPDTHNLMSYSVKHCRDLFTPEQIAKMEYTYLTYRPELNIPPLEPNISLTQTTVQESEGDGDDVINPGETARLWITLENHPDWPDASNVEVFLVSLNEEAELLEDYFSIPVLNAGETAENSLSPFVISFGPTVPLGSYPFELVIQAEGTDNAPFNRIFPLSINVTLFQTGWPVFAVGDTINQVKSSPLIMNENEDDNDEVFFADYNGTVFFMNPSGEGVENELFPFHAGNSIWGSLAAADVDNDNQIEIVLTSKDKHLYILDILDQSVDLDFDAGQFLISAPALGNADDDDDPEIFFGGYSSSGKLFGINPDGSNIPGFPVDINEKIRGGIALADVNGNGKVDIALGTEGYHIWLIYDDGTVAPGFPFLTSGKIRTAPAILMSQGEFTILAGDDDGNLYALDIQGGLRFLFTAASGITTGMGLLNLEGSAGIFFGCNNGEIFGITADGVPMPGWPVNTGGTVNSTPVISDLNNDGLPEIVSGTQTGDLFAFGLQGDLYPHFPVQSGFQIMSSPTVRDIDHDGDLEIIAGTTHSVVAIDVKEPGISSGYWNTFQGNPLRTGFFVAIDSGCGIPQVGDLNCDGDIDILDVVRLVQIIVHPEEIPPSEFEMWAGDLNGDEIDDVLDVVNLVNLIVN